VNRPIIICCPVKNELHNLSRLIPAWSLYADHIIIADQASEDGSIEFLKQSPKVRVIHNRDSDYNENNRINLMVAAAREISTSSVLLFLDADESLSANVLNSIEWNTFIRSAPGTAGYFRWVQLWGSVRHYIARGRTGVPVHMPFALVDDGTPLSDGAVMHGPRGPGLGRPKRVFFFNDVVNMHFFMTNREIYRKKQNWYKLYWHRRGGRYFHTNRNHCVYESVTFEEVGQSPADWYEGFVERGIDLLSCESDSLTWYDVEILKYMNDHGVRRLWLLDIWNQDWDWLRELAIRAGRKDMPTGPIVGPPSWIRFYTDWSLGRLPVSKMIRSAGRFAKRKLLP
jgi:hypothetical protein